MITGPKVGSSAKAETSESSMKAAGLKIGLKAPFKMSEMIGKSLNTQLKLAKSTEQNMEEFYGWNNGKALEEITGGANYRKKQGEPQTSLKDTPQLDGHPIVAAGNTAYALFAYITITFSRPYFEAKKLPSNDFLARIDELGMNIRFQYLAAAPFKDGGATFYPLYEDGRQIEENDRQRFAKALATAKTMTIHILKWY